MRVLLLALLLAPGAALAADWVPKPTADLIVLDKIRGQPSPVQVKVGDTARFGSLSIKVESCVVRPPDQPENAAAFVDVTDRREQGAVFRGWMVQNDPSVSQMDHPVYDLRLAGCR